MVKAKNSLGIIMFPAFDWAISPTHPEREERLLYTQDQLVEEGLFDIEGITEYKPVVASFDDVERVHFCLPDVYSVCTPSHLASAGGAITAAKLVMEKKKDKAFALVRPPGHHAMKVVHGCRGFCTVNIEAVMIEAIREQYGPLRIAIVDTDCHHGDGTQDVYWNDPNTLFISMHQDGRTLYPGTGHVNELGGVNARGATLNIPLPPSTGDAGFLHVMDNLVLPVLDAFKPDLIINSAGQDNHFTDPITNMNITAQGYALLNQKLNPHISVLEGGYAIQGALPYVNLGICLAMAGLDYSHVEEPLLHKYDLQQSAKITEYIARLCDNLRTLYFSPEEIPQYPPNGEVEGEYFCMKKNIYYDTDNINEEQVQKTRICNNCGGLVIYETKADRKPWNACIEIPQTACDVCKTKGLEELTSYKHNNRFRSVLFNNRIDKHYERHGT